MNKQFIYDNKGKKTAVVILIKEWEDIKSKLKKNNKKEKKEESATDTKSKKVIAPKNPIIKVAAKKSTTPKATPNKK
ncbi:MAG: hypothetical protein WCP57_08955 [Bacteroidota bacterium]